MHAFVVVGAKPGRAVPEPTRAVLADRHPLELPFVPADHVSWSDGEGRLCFAGWQTAGGPPGIGGRWDVRPAGLAALTGLVWLDARPWRTGRTWAAQLADELARTPLDQQAPDLVGVGAVASLSAHGSGLVTADPLGVAVLYVAETADVTVVGTRAALVARAVAGLGRPLPRDLEGAAWMAYSGNQQLDRTTFDGVRTVPPASIVRFSADRPAAVETWSAMPWLEGPPLVSPAAVEEAIEATAQHLRALARLTATVAPRPALELTGGRDSRLVLSLLVAEGLAEEVECLTWGEPDLPDVVVAGAITERLGLAHRAAGTVARPRRGVGPRPAAPTSAVAGLPVAERYEAELRHHVHLTSGASSIWDLVAGADRPPDPHVALTGLLGGALFTTYPASGGIERPCDLRAIVVAGRLRADGARLLRPDVRRHHDRLVVEQLEALVPPGGTPQDAIDGYCQAVRLRRWLGPAHEHDRRNRTFPLYSMPAMRTAFGLGADRRHRHLLVFEVMRRCSDDLARLPFGGRPWPEGATALAPDPTAYPTAPPVPLWRVPRSPQVRYRAGRLRRQLRHGVVRANHVRAMTSVVEVHRMADLQAKMPVLRALVDLDRNHAIFELVDRRALHRSIDELESLGFRARRAVHDAITAAMWLSGADAPLADPRT